MLEGWFWHHLHRSEETLLLLFKLSAMRGSSGSEFKQQITSGDVWKAPQHVDSFRASTVLSEIVRALSTVLYTEQKADTDFHSYSCIEQHQF